MKKVTNKSGHYLNSSMINKKRGKGESIQDVSFFLHKAMAEAASADTHAASADAM